MQTPGYIEESHQRTLEIQCYTATSTPEQSYVLDSLEIQRIHFDWESFLGLTVRRIFIVYGY